MTSPFKLNAALGRTYNTDLDDVLQTKRALSRLGHYETPSYGIDEYPDEPLFQGIERFQELYGLQRDGIMKPDGQTATKLGEVLNAEERKDTRPVPAAFGLTAEVGPGRANTPHDVNATSQALAWAGFPHLQAGAVGGDGLVDATKRFQQSKNLKVDGWLRPYGETEKALNRVLQPKVEALRVSAASPTPAGDPGPLLQAHSRRKGGIRVPIPKGVYEIAMFFGLPVLAAMDWLRSMSEAQKEQIGIQISGQHSGTDERLEAFCDYLHYEVDVPMCNSLKKSRGKEAVARCMKTANDRYAACLHGVPPERLPPLDTWNN